MALTFFIQSKLNGDVIDILGSSAEAGTGLDAWPLKSTGNLNQLWSLVPDPLGSGYFYIQSALSQNVIDILGASTEPGTRLDAWPMKATGNQNQLWNFVADPAGSGYVFIQSLLGGSNGGVIDILGASTEPGTGLDVWPMKAADYDNQLWQIVVFATNQTPPFLIQALTYLNTSGEGPQPGSTHGSPFTPLGFAVNNSGTIPPQSENPDGSGNYQVTVANGTVLTLGEPFEASGTRIVTPNGAAASQLINVTLPQSNPPLVIWVQTSNPVG
jgi:hypothetical protein